MQFFGECVDGIGGLVELIGEVGDLAVSFVDHFFEEGGLVGHHVGGGGVGCCLFGSMCCEIID